MDDIETLMMRRRGVAPQPLNANDVSRMILDFSQELGNQKAFSTIEGGIAELARRNPEYAKLSPDQKRNLYMTALEDLASKETKYTGGSGAGMGKFGRLLLTGLGVASKAVDVIRNPSEIVNVAQEFLGPALQQLTDNHPNNPPASQGSGSSLVGGGLEEFLPKIVEKVEELSGRVSKLEGGDGVPVPQ